LTATALKRQKRHPQQGRIFKDGMVIGKAAEFDHRVMLQGDVW
jgi:hypothetical protein